MGGGIAKRFEVEEFGGELHGSSLRGTPTSDQAVRVRA
jgi:hypothetical protein